MTPSTEDTLRTIIQTGLLLRAKAHMWHLQTSSYAQHMAFEELYTTLGEFTDRLAETAMGNGFAVLPAAADVRWQFEFTAATKWYEDHVLFITGLQSLSTQLQTEKLGFLQNIVDEFQGNLMQIAYKLQRFS